MIKINGWFNFVVNFNNQYNPLFAKADYVVELDINSFDDIDEEKMSIEESDVLIEKAITKKYGVIPTHIWVGKEVKE